jgi:tetraacyldisaccharide 4'-kinase
MYAPHAAVISDADPRRAAESAMSAFRPDLLMVHDGLSRPSPARDAQIVVLGQDDLGPWFNRPVPAGRWREDASALRRADLFVVHMDPERFTTLTALITKRLARFGRPVVSVFPRAWRLRRAGTRETTGDFGGEPYLLLTTNPSVAPPPRPCPPYCLRRACPSSSRTATASRSRICASSSTTPRA